LQTRALYNVLDALIQCVVCSGVSASLDRPTLLAALEVVVIEFNLAALTHITHSVD
jgi:hypothetical protein